MRIYATAARVREAATQGCTVTIALPWPKCSSRTWRWVRLTQSVIAAVLATGCGRYGYEQVISVSDRASASLDGGSSPGPGLDAGQDGSSGVMDAQTTSDAQPSPDAGFGNCAGTENQGLCWHLGPLGASCVETCAPYGDFDPRTTMLIGSPAQGGTLEGCAEVLRALAYPRTPTAGSRVNLDGLGLGCHVFPMGGGSFWLSEPDFDPNDKGEGVQIACGCTR